MLARYEYLIVTHRRSQDFWLGGAQTLKNSAVFTEIESEFWTEIENSNDFSAQNQVISKKKNKKVFTEIKSDFSAENQVISKKKKKKKKVFTELNIVRLCCHNFLSLVEFWLGGARAPWAPPGYAYVVTSDAFLLQNNAFKLTVCTALLWKKIL